MRLILDRAVRLSDGGRVLVIPGRVIRLTDAGPQALRALLADTATPAQRRLGDRLVRAGMAHPRPAPTRADATVVIPVKDRPEDLAHCLDPLGENVIVVDDGSAVPVVCEGVAVVRRERCGGPAAARNAGVEQVTTELVAFLDSDTVAAPDWIERLAGHFEDASVAAVAPRVVGRRSPLDMGPRPAEVGSPRVPYVPAAALIVRREHAWFDPDLRYGEDVDLIWRLLAGGHRVRYDPSVIVRHCERDTLRRRFLYGTSAAPLHARHPTRLRHVVFTRPRPLRVARELRVPRRLALLWAAQALVQTGRAVTKLGSPYGAGVLYGRIRSKIGGLPTI